MTDTGQFTCVVRHLDDLTYSWESVIYKGDALVHRDIHSNLWLAERKIKRTVRALKRTERKGIEVR